jgi:hypothetical protein
VPGYVLDTSVSVANSNEHRSGCSVPLKTWEWNCLTRGGTVRFVTKTHHSFLSSIYFHAYLVSIHSLFVIFRHSDYVRQQHKTHKKILGCDVLHLQLRLDKSF